jgi:hypothetical protein
VLAQSDELNELERQMLGPQMAGALQGLPAADRDALLLLAWADLDYEQISQALDCRWAPSARGSTAPGNGSATTWIQKTTFER